MEIALRVASSPSLSGWDRFVAEGVSLASGSIFYHAGMRLSDGKLITATPSAGVCMIEQVFEPGEWTFFPIPDASLWDENDARLWCQVHRGCKYDFTGDGGFLMRWLPRPIAEQLRKLSFFHHQRNHYFCSMVTVILAQRVSLFHEVVPTDVCPGDLPGLCLAAGLVPRLSVSQGVERRPAA